MGVIRSTNLYFQAMDATKLTKMTLARADFSVSRYPCFFNLIKVVLRSVKFDCDTTKWRSRVYGFAILTTWKYGKSLSTSIDVSPSQLKAKVRSASWNMALQSMQEHLNNNEVIVVKKMEIQCERDIVLKKSCNYHLNVNFWLIQKHMKKLPTAYVR